MCWQTGFITAVLSTKYNKAVVQISIAQFANRYLMFKMYDMLNTQYLCHM